MPDHQPHPCPHCGYDMTGEVARWTRRCPLRVRCPECGRESLSTLLFRDQRIVGADPYSGRRIPGPLVAIGCVLVLAIPAAILALSALVFLLP